MKGKEKTKPAKTKDMISYFSWESAMILFTIVLGILLHFTYQWSMNNPIVAAVSAVNESTWEHIKIAIWPAFLLSIVYNVKTKPRFQNYAVALGGLFSTIIFIIPTFFYTYSGIIGTHFLPIDITLFVMAVIFGWYMFFCLIADKNDYSMRSVIICAVFDLAVLAAFLYFTYAPPSWGIFIPPVIN